jgi:4-aminobutyrate aminotransferase-like enzyme
MDAAEVRKKHKELLFPNVVTYYEESVVPESALGMTVTDKDGKKYLDFFGGILTVSVGHSHPKVTEAVRDQAGKLVHLSTLYPNEPQVQLAEKLYQIRPPGMGPVKSFFTSSGTEADETAVMTAKLATGEREIIALRHSYSGRSTMATNLMGHASWRVLSSEIAGIKHAHAPYCYRCDLGLKYPDCGIACAKDIEPLIQTTTHGRIAAFLAEPIMGVGGFITPPKEYFQVAVPIVRKYGGLFIADEVQTGWGRIGASFWATEFFGVQPDIFTSAKGMANGAPIGMTVARAEVADAFKNLSIATFGGNPVSMRAALATISVIEEEKLMFNAKVVGDHLRNGLEALKERFPAIGDVRGMGLMQAIELVKDRGTKEPDPAGTNRIMEATKKRRLLLGKGGLYGNTMRIAPPMIASKTEVDEAIRILGEALQEAYPA